MSSQLSALCFDAHDPARLASFWGIVLGRDVIGGADDGIVVMPSDAFEFRIRFLNAHAPKTGPNRMHLDLTSTSLDDQWETAARALELGARHIDIGQRPEEGHIVLADPEDNEFCVIGPSNDFLAETGRIGALSSDGTQAVGHFWSAALGWPLVWDQDEETAIQSPHGGTKISWGGPPVSPKLGKNRHHLDLTPPPDGDQQAEVARLISLGATIVDAGRGELDLVVMADPDGNEFCVTAPGGSLDL